MLRKDEIKVQKKKFTINRVNYVDGEILVSLSTWLWNHWKSNDNSFGIINILQDNYKKYYKNTMIWEGYLSDVLGSLLETARLNKEQLKKLNITKSDFGWIVYLLDNIPYELEVTEMIKSIFNVMWNDI